MRAEVTKAWLSARAAGRHGDLPIPDPSVVLRDAEDWVLVEVPIHLCDNYAVDPDVVQAYLARGTSDSWPPVIGFVEDGLRGPFVFVEDGNHRVAAARALGHKSIRAYVPAEDFPVLHK